MRALRRRRCWRQVDLAESTGVSQSVISRAERGHIGSLSVSVVRRILNGLEARAGLSVTWRGGEIDRLLDEDHAALGSTVAADLVHLDWRVWPEVTFMRRGERGSIDLVGAQEARRAAIIFELKSELTSYEEMQRRFDAKATVAASIIEERFGWRPRHLAVVLVLAESRTNRDRATRVAPLLKAALPAGNVEVRRWLKRPEGNLAGVWFVRISRRRTANRGRGGSHRVRVPRATAS